MTEFIIINPGSGPCKNATEEEAIKNMHQFNKDLEIKGTFSRIPENDYNEEYQDGRFAFLLNINSRIYEIQMPGLPLENVRYLKKENQSIWDFPRMYVDGSSWVWFFALAIINGGDDE